METTTQPPTDVDTEVEKMLAETKLADIKFDKKVRVDLDYLLQSLKAQSPSRERALAITKIQECIMWLGMDLKRLGGPNPYPHSYDPTSPVVDPTADNLTL